MFRNAPFVALLGMAIAGTAAPASAQPPSPSFAGKTVILKIGWPPGSVSAGDKIPQ